MVKVKYIFYRILGNDLPPRHRQGQTLANLKMILEREPVLKDVEKRWIVNRIVEPSYEKEITGLLEKHRQKYQVIAFNRKRFKKIPKQNFNQRLEEMIGLNKARNRALRQGKRLGRWVLVFDGNCFFTAPAWQKIARACLMGDDIKYLLVPMIRISAGKGFLSEPQIIFRNDSKAKFDENFAYGKDSKVDLLRRLTPRGRSVAIAGHVWRLPSGNEEAEKDIQKRKQDREQGILDLMSKVDQR